MGAAELLPPLAMQSGAKRQRIGPALSAGDFEVLKHVCLLHVYYISLLRNILK